MQNNIKLDERWLKTYRFRVITQETMKDISNNYFSFFSWLFFSLLFILFTHYSIEMTQNCPRLTCCIWGNYNIQFCNTFNCVFNSFRIHNQFESAMKNMLRATWVLKHGAQFSCLTNIYVDNSYLTSTTGADITSWVNLIYFSICFSFRFFHSCPFLFFSIEFEKYLFSAKRNK